MHAVKIRVSLTLIEELMNFQYHTVRPVPRGLEKRN